MSFEVPAEPMPLPLVFNADNLAHSYPFAWGDWNVTAEANASYSLVPAIRPQDLATIEPSIHAPIRIALIGPEEVAAVAAEPLEVEPGNIAFYVKASFHPENPWITVGATQRLDLGQEYIETSLTGQTPDDLAQARAEGKFPLENVIMEAAGEITRGLAVNELFQTQTQAKQRALRGIHQALFGGTVFIGDMISEVAITADMPYITLPVAAAAFGLTMRGAHNMGSATNERKRAEDTFAKASTIAAVRGLVVANSIHNIYAPARED